MIEEVKLTNDDNMQLRNAINTHFAEERKKQEVPALQTSTIEYLYVGA